MSNLGAYQVMTTLAKRAGGPLKLALGVAIGGYVVIRAGEGTVKTVVKKVKGIKGKDDINEQILYSVHKSGKSNEGLIFEEGDYFVVLERDGEAVLIEKIGDKNNPYFVSEGFLRGISDFGK